MGFLSSSRFAEYLACAHTCLTAEGDNRVLMHKIVKDLTNAVNKKGYKLLQPRMNVKTQVGTMDDVSQLETLSDLFRFRQIVLLQKLGAKFDAEMTALLSELRKQAHREWNLAHLCARLDYNQYWQGRPPPPPAAAPG